MRVCVIGAGGREHALALALARTADVVVTPGNAGIAAAARAGHRLSVTPVPPEEVEADLFVVGPEAPLVDGLADRLRQQGRRVFGPGADGARLEGSKAFMKEMLAEAAIPTARFGVFDRVPEAVAFLRTLPGPWVVKTDGLAAGKGVLVTMERAVAEADVEAKLSGRSFGDAGRRVVIEEGLIGEECSLIALCDGRRVVPLAPARDAKRLADGDQGPNTGGMGAYSPLPDVDDADVGRLVETTLEPLVATLARRGIDFRGVLYAGLMLTPEGPKVLEYNVRFGDPETQAVLARLDGDLTGLLAAAADGELRDAPSFSPDASVCVVLAAPGYPAAARTGETVTGLGPDGQLAVPVPGVTVHHAGTEPGPEGTFCVSGGRVLACTAVAPTVPLARAAAYEGMAGIGLVGGQYRRDIALHATAEHATAEHAAEHPTRGHSTAVGDRPIGAAS